MRTRRFAPARAGGSRRRLVGVVLAGVAAIGLGTASAAQLSVQARTLAAGTGQVGDCQAGAPIRVELLSEWSGNQFVTTGARLHDVADACEGLNYRVTLIRTAGAPVEVSGTVPVADDFNTQTFGAVSTSSIDEAKVVIHS